MLGKLSSLAEVVTLLRLKHVRIDLAYIDGGGLRIIDMFRSITTQSPSLFKVKHVAGQSPGHMVNFVSQM